MSMNVLRWLMPFLLFSNTLAFANQSLTFSDPQTEKRYYTLIEEIRCLVCQNQSLADSNADLARDLRDQIYQMIRGGKQDQAIYQYLVERYGDFILYRPPLQKNTWLLWFAPFLFLLISVVATIIIIKRQAHKTATISHEQQALLTKIVLSDPNENKHS